MAVIRRLRSDTASEDILYDIRALLLDAFDGGFSNDDWHHALGGWHVVVEDGGTVVSHAAVVPRNLEVAGSPVRAGYVEGVATAKTRQGQGLGSRAMADAADLIDAEFEMGALSTGAHRFYERLGWERWQGPTYVRRGTDLIRTEDEDDGVMVLRLGGSKQIDRAGPISCEARSGDDW